MSSPLVTQIVADALQPHPKKLDKKAHATLYPALRMVFPGIAELREKQAERPVAQETPLGMSVWVKSLPLKSSGSPVTLAAA